ncbi:TIM barrel protein [Sinomonas notoginsengisoli]|uniref:sugar phosphate isomerase/epimerase family protein n=1 Tax=Sinomonas notoginsengisoli TaxID=1457311 RepID=UPI001F28DB92|nr:TIM barrel protein [Sinomonas notoginsengisoli]
MPEQGRVLSLAHLSVVDAHPLELIDAAVAGGFNAIGLRIVPPMPTDEIIPVVGDEKLLAEVIRKKDDCGIMILDTEALWLTPEIRPKDLEPVLETSARLGATNILVVGNDPDPGRQQANYAELCDLAAAHGLTAAVEFIPYCATGTLAGAQDLVLGAGRPNAKFLIDVLHLMRSGDGPEALSALVPEAFAYCQLADLAGPRPQTTALLRQEARTDRRFPGEGEAPLAQILDALPPGLPLGVEAPVLKHRDLPVVERGRLCGEATRAFLDAYDSGRRAAQTAPADH